MSGSIRPSPSSSSTTSRRGVRHVFGLCGHTNIAVLAAMAEQHRLRQRAPRTGRRPRRRWLRPGQRSPFGGPQPPQPWAHQRRHRCRQRRARLHPDGGDRRRRPVALLRPAPAPGGQPPRRCRPTGDLPAVRPSAWRVDKAELFPRSSTRPSCSPRMASPGRSSSTCRWTSSPSRWTPHCSLASTTAPRRCAGRPSTTRRRRRSSPASPRPERPVMYVGGGVLLARASEAPTVRRAPRPPGGLQPDGQGRPERRPPRRWG